MQLRTDPLLQAFDDALALIEDDDQRERFSRVLAASRPAVDRAAVDLVGDVVDTINEALGDEARVQLTVASDGVSVAVTRPDADVDDTAPSLAATTEEMERLTLRLPAEVKAQATTIAAEAAMSLNTWIVRSIARALARELERDRRRRSGRRRRRGSLRGRVGD